MSPQIVTRRSALGLIGSSAAATIFSGCGSSLNFAGQTPPESYDFVVVGATVPGILAAQIAARSGAKVCIIESTQHVGGMLTNGGLGVTDSNQTATMGGFTQQLFRDVATYYKKPAGSLLYSYEPHAMEAILLQYLAIPNITVHLGRTLQTVVKSGTQITSATLDNGEVIAGTVWADMSYEGDLMALSGASYAVGRESEAQYGEQWAGFQITALDKLNPFLDGNVTLPLVGPYVPQVIGQADSKVAAYCYRVCVSVNPKESVPFSAPADYNPDIFSGLLRTISAQGLTTHRNLFSSGYLPDSTTGKSGVKFCVENSGVFSIDCPAFDNWRYPNATWADRDAIAAHHKSYTQAWFYFLTNDPRVPSTIRADFARYGLAADEFTDNGNWPIQLYIREGRRLIGSYILKMQDVTAISPTKPSSVGIGQASIDCHRCDRFAAADGKTIIFDGNLETNTYTPYEMPFECTVPNPAEVTNLLVGVCFSSSHVGWSAARTEPTLSILGEAVGYAAIQALQSGKGVADTDIAALQASLVATGSILHV